MGVCLLYLALPREIVLLVPASVQRYQQVCAAVSVGDWKTSIGHLLPRSHCPLCQRLVFFSFILQLHRRWNSRLASATFNDSPAVMVLCCTVNKFRDATGSMDRPAVSLPLFSSSSSSSSRRLSSSSAPTCNFAAKGSSGLNLPIHSRNAVASFSSFSLPAPFFLLPNATRR